MECVLLRKETKCQLHGEFKPMGVSETMEIQVGTYEWARAMLKQGALVTREKWKERGWFIAMQFPDENSKMKQPYVYMAHEDGMVPWSPQAWDENATDYKIHEVTP